MMVVPGGVGKSKNLVPLHSYSTYLPPRLSLVRVGTLNEDARANKGNGGGEMITMPKTTQRPLSARLSYIRVTTWTCTILRCDDFRLL
jgi:hypothetical protein